MGRKPSSIICLLLAGITMSLVASAVRAAERPCGIVWGQSREIDESRRFELLGTGEAFVDMRTCLVWSLRPIPKREIERTLSEGVQVCATLGQGGPHGEMGWQLPTIAELTSLDGREWGREAGNFAQYHLPVAERSDDEFWTSSPWLGQPNSWAVVQFSGRTTVVRPLGLGEKAGVWCVRGVPARGLRTP